jgi:hypothetical protein
MSRLQKLAARTGAEAGPRLPSKDGEGERSGGGELDGPRTGVSREKTAGEELAATAARGEVGARVCILGGLGAKFKASQPDSRGLAEAA